MSADKTNIIMDVYTQEPGIQFYGGNFMQSENSMKAGSKDDFRIAFCLETQHFPDSPNQPSFPSTVLEPGKVYATSAAYKFSIKKSRLFRHLFPLIEGLFLPAVVFYSIIVVLLSCTFTVILNNETQSLFNSKN